jgi:cytochrome c
LASLVGLALACQLPNGGNRENKAKTTAASRTAPLSAPKPPERGEAAENTTAAATEEAPAEPVPCAATDFNYPAIQAACAEGGRSAVKKLMNGAIAKAKRAGTELKCSNCHMDQKTFGLRPNAVDDLANWL